MPWHIWEKSTSMNSRKTIQNRVVEITLHNNVLHNNKRLIVIQNICYAIG